MRKRRSRHRAYGRQVSGARIIAQVMVLVTGKSNCMKVSCKIQASNIASFQKALGVSFRRLCSLPGSFLDDFGSLWGHFCSILGPLDPLGYHWVPLAGTFEDQVGFGSKSGPKSSPKMSHFLTHFSICSQFCVSF